VPQVSSGVTDRDDGPSPVNETERETSALYKSQAPGLLRYALTFVDDSNCAQDAVQEIFLRYFIARSEGRQFRSPKAWLFRVLRNHLLDTLKSARKKNEIAIEGIEYSPDRWNDPEKHYHRTEMELEIIRLLAPRELECVRLRTEGLSYDEITEVLDLRPGTVGATLARAHTKIRRLLASTHGLKRQKLSQGCIIAREENSYSS